MSSIDIFMPVIDGIFCCKFVQTTDIVVLTKMQDDGKTTVVYEEKVIMI
jgi:hypothetical protein